MLDAAHGEAESSAPAVQRENAVSGETKEPRRLVAGQERRRRPTI